MFLILDFTRNMNMALVTNNQFFYKKRSAQNQISELLINDIEKFILSSKRKLEDLTAIYVITGPGSFTGVRSALTYAKVLKLTLQIKVFGVSKFEILNNIAKLDNRKNKYIIIQNKEKDFFIQNFNFNNPSGPPQLSNFDQDILKLKKGSTIICDSENFRVKLSKKGSSTTQIDVNYVKYNLKILSRILINVKEFKNDPKPLYISNYY